MREERESPAQDAHEPLAQEEQELQAQGELSPPALVEQESPVQDGREPLVREERE